MAFSPAATLRKQATHRVAFFAALVFCCFGVACTEDAHPLQMDWVDTDGTAVSLRIEDGRLNLYGDGELALPDVRFTQFVGRDMSFSTREDFTYSAESTAPDNVVVTGVQRLLEVFEQAASHRAQADDAQQTEAPPAAAGVPSVEWTDTEGDVVSLRGTGGFVGLWANGEEVMPNVAGVQLYNDGASMEFVSGEMTALTVVRDASDVRRIQDFLTTHARGTPPGGGAAPQSAQQQAAALQAFEQFVQQQKERSRQRPEIAGIFIEDQKDLAEPNAVVTQHHVLHLGRRTFAQTVLPSTRYPVENWVVMFCYSWYEPCQDIMDPYSAWSRDWEAKLNQDLFTTRVRFARVDCATDKELCNAQDVEGYPHIKQYSEGVAVAKWTGGRQKDAARLAKWLTKRLGAPAEPEGGEQLEEVQPDPSLVARERGINALLVLGVSALVFRAVCLDAELWKGPTTAPPAAAQDGHSAPPAGPRGLPAEWARRGSVEL
mmetsp:Transcript_46618/g.124574  ORF Transcript_46618/g.124574 Transcript_46618/m.124574 type:complete len:488 (+) Transcript_46618:119-1582(+)